jgi:uncharacterized protein YeeX (DUF496 family)
MTLQELFNALDSLTDEDIEAVREYLEKRDQEKWVREFDEAVQALQEGLTQDEAREIIAAINTEYIEASDDELWQE